MCNAIAYHTRTRILISNDDGIDAPGLQLLEKIVHTITDDVWVVAPEIEQSGASHAITLHRPLRVRMIDERHYTVNGTPGDCVLLAINKFLKDHKPDLILSGINRGGNLGEDVHYSGTIAAAMEGTLLGVRSLALSQVFTTVRTIHWETSERFVSTVIRLVTCLAWNRNVFFSANFPDVEPDAVSSFEIVRQGKRKIGDHLEERLDPRGCPYMWISGQRSEDYSLSGTDLEAICRGAITITPLFIDLTHLKTLDALQVMFLMSESTDRIRSRTS